MSNTINIPATITANGSGKTVTVNPSKWSDVQGFAEYLMTYACGVILQRASAGKTDDAEKAEKAVKAAIERLETGVVPSGGGFTKLTPTEYAMKEVLMAKKVKFEKGETVILCLARVGAKLTPREKDVSEEDYENAVQATIATLTTELESDEVYKSALKARTAKTKSSKDQTGLISQL